MFPSVSPDYIREESKPKEKLLKELKVLRAQLAILEEEKAARKRAEEETDLLKTLIIAISEEENMDSALTIALKKVCSRIKSYLPWCLKKSPTCKLVVGNSIILFLKAAIGSCEKSNKWTFVKPFRNKYSPSYPFPQPGIKIEIDLSFNWSMYSFIGGETCFKSQPISDFWYRLLQYSADNFSIIS